MADADLDVLAPLRHPQAGTIEQLALMARAHGSTVVSLARSGPVLPVPLGTLLGDDDAVRAVLRRRADELRDELDRVAAHAEWEVTVQLAASREGDVPEPAGCTTPGGRRDRSWDGRTVAAQGAALDAQRAGRKQRRALAESFHAGLAAHAVEARRLRGRGSDRSSAVVLRGAYLVADMAADRFHHAVAAVRERCSDAVVDVTGPWPAYHFLRVDLTL